MIKPIKVLCKRTLTNGKTYWWDDEASPPVRHERDNRMLVEGNWYDVIESKNDSWDTEKRQFTFTIIDNHNSPHLFFMYEEQDKKNWPDICNLYGPRDYAKWFYTPEELIALEKGEFKLLEDIVIYPGNYHWVKANPGAWIIAYALSKTQRKIPGAVQANTIEWYVPGSDQTRISEDFIEIGEQVGTREQQINNKKERISTEELLDEVAILIDSINKPDPDKEYPSVEYVMPFVNQAMDNYLDTSFANLSDLFETEE